MLKVAKQIHAGNRELQDRAQNYFVRSGLIIAVADGAGGMSGGAEAAEYTVNRVGKATETIIAGGPESIRELLISIDREMSNAGNFGQTTCVIIYISEGKISGASVGDSGALVIRGGEIDSLTAYQSRKPFIGSGSAMPVNFTRDNFEGTLVVASDGLLKYTSEERIAAAIEQDLEQSAKKLVELVRYPSGALPDDVAVVLARNE